MGFVLVLFLVTITTQKKLKIIKLFGIIFAAIAIHEIILNTDQVIYYIVWASGISSIFGTLRKSQVSTSLLRITINML